MPLATTCRFFLESNPISESKYPELGLYLVLRPCIKALPHQLYMDCHPGYHKSAQTQEERRRLSDLKPLNEWSDQVGQEHAVVDRVQVVKVQQSLAQH